MAISAKVTKMLLAHSGGYCQNPECHRDLFVLFESGDVSSFEELAHIIAQKVDGPRGGELELSERDEYENIILLCSVCHTLVDKNPKHFPVELLRNWKTEHAAKIRTFFEVPNFSSRDDLRNEVRRLLRANRAIFDAYGPHSETSDNPMSDAAEMWKHLIQTDIIPNNRRLGELFSINDDLLTNEEKIIVDKFVVHKTAFEYNHLSGDKNSSAPLFPSEINTVLED
ncbi:MAG: HNH endonuclease [Anaerolineales bacterium]|nr:HNH endonuclease [Anaerolineales bacterium]